MKAGKIKLGRNDACSCGSGKKYKRCCLTAGVFSQEKPLIAHDLIQKSMLGLKNRVQDNMGGTCIMHDGELEVKMSEVRHHRTSRWLDEWDSLKGCWSMYQNSTSKVPH